MQIRCYRCGWSFAIKREEAAFALQALEETGGNHYDTSCPRCRHSNRVSLEQLRKAAPKSAEASEAQLEAEDGQEADASLSDEAEDSGATDEETLQENAEPAE